MVHCINVYAAKRQRHKKKMENKKHENFCNYTQDSQESVWTQQDNSLWVMIYAIKSIYNYLVWCIPIWKVEQPTTPLCVTI